MLLFEHAYTGCRDLFSVEVHRQDSAHTHSCDSDAASAAAVSLAVDSSHDASGSYITFADYL